MTTAGAQHRGIALELLLERWGRWAAASVPGDYPPTSTLYRIMYQIPPSTGTRPELSDPHAERMERLIVELREVHDLWAAAVVLKYADRRPVPSKARALRVSVRKLYYLAEQGEAWLLGRLASV